MVVAILVPVRLAARHVPERHARRQGERPRHPHGGLGQSRRSNVGRLLGWRYGLLVLVMDFAKGALAAGVGLAVGGRPGAFVLGAAAIVGHTFPLYRKGGKGVAAGRGDARRALPADRRRPRGRLGRRRARAQEGVARVAARDGAVPRHGLARRDTTCGRSRCSPRSRCSSSLRHAANIRRLVRREEIDLNSGGSVAPSP